jgi:hypothetical protein
MGTSVIPLFRLSAEPLQAESLGEKSQNVKSGQETDAQPGVVWIGHIGLMRPVGWRQSRGFFSGSSSFRSSTAPDERELIATENRATLAKLRV